MVVPSTNQSSILAASWQKNGSIDLIQKQMPTIKPGEILVKVAASGLCGKSWAFLATLSGPYGLIIWF